MKRAKLAQLHREIAALKVSRNVKETLKGTSIEKFNNFMAHMTKQSKIEKEECVELSEKLKYKELELQKLFRATEVKERTYSQQGYDGQQKHQFLLAQNDNQMRQLKAKEEHVEKEGKTYWDMQIEEISHSNKVTAKGKEFAEKYSNLTTLENDAINPLKKVDLPSPVMLCNDFRVNLPDLKNQQNLVNSSSVMKNEITTALDNLKVYLAKQNGYVKDILAVQNNSMHELEMKMSELNVKMDLVKPQSFQKQRKKDSNAKKLGQEILKLKEQQDIGASRLEMKQKYLAQLENQISSLKQKLETSNVKLQEIAQMHDLYRTRAKEVFDETKDQKDKSEEVTALLMNELADLV